MIGATPLADQIRQRDERWQAYLRDIASGNTQSVARLYDETVSVLHSLSVRILGNSADAEEVMLEVFEQVWRNAKSLNPARGTVWRWLTLLTRSRALDRLRVSANRRVHEQVGLTGSPELRSLDPIPEQASLFREQQQLIRSALCSLPKEQCQALELAYFSGLTHVEIAATLGVPLGTIKTRIRMGMDKLRLSLGKRDKLRASNTG